ncbi:hypothetical protein HF086_008556, partial [Spodoptera exigua]
MYYVTGMHFSQSVAIIQSQVGTIRGVQVLYSDQNPLSVDLVINMPQDGIRLIFDPVAQRLKVIEIYNMKLVKLRYSGMCFNSPEISPSIEQVEHCFGATHPGLYDSQRHLFALNFRGLSFYFPVDSKFEKYSYFNSVGYVFLSAWLCPRARLPSVPQRWLAGRLANHYLLRISTSAQLPPDMIAYLEMYVFIGRKTISCLSISLKLISDLDNSPGGVCGAPLPELPLSCYRHQLHLRRCDVLRTATATQGLRLHMFTEGPGRSLSEGGAGRSVCRVVRFGSSAQRVCAALGAPARTYYKADDKMRIHRPTARRRPPPASDYFFNYFTLGLDVLFDARTHQVKKFVLHTNYPGHYNFNMYHRCEFELTVQPDKCEANSLVESRGAVCITAYSKWEVVSRALRVAERPVVLNRASSTNTTNPFGSTFCYGYQDIIFEVT